MRDWNLGDGDPLSLVLAADARLTVPDYSDDQTWELEVAGGDPPAFGIGTTYGLRARGMRIFAGFGLGSRIVTDPSAFHEPPRVRRFYPNYASVSMKPFPGLRVEAEFWVPNSRTLGGRFLLVNTEGGPQEVRLDLHAILRPGENGQPMREQVMGGSSALVGRTGDLQPAVFLATGAILPQSPFPTLAVKHLLEPGMGKAVIWATSASGDVEESFRAARELVGCSWDSEIARVELLNESLLDVRSGDPSWDAAFALAQKQAIASYVGPTPRLPHPSFVLSREPGKGYSERGDGSDYGRLWNGQSVAEAYGHLPLLLPAAPELAKGLVRNFLVHQGSDGFVDGKPGLAGQRSGTHAMPLLATLTSEIYNQSEDIAFVRECLPRLADYLELWFSPAHDRDGDGFPEWDHTLHACFDDWPAFVRWGVWGQGLDITTAETLDLASYLYRECRSIVSLGRIAGETSYEERFSPRMEKLRRLVESSWSDETGSYHHLDRDTHRAYSGEKLGSGKGAFDLEIGRRFPFPVRIVVKVLGVENQRHALQVFLHGTGARGRHRVERLGERDFSWYWGIGSSTSAKTYLEIDRVEARGISTDFEVEVRAADYTRQDLSLLLPLWAGIPSPERARLLVERTVLDPARYWRPFGIPTTSASDPSYSPDGSHGAGTVWLLWNAMIGEGLLDYGNVGQAAELLTRLMQPIVHSLREHHAFYEAYNPELLEGIGERHHLGGLAPLGLFLKLLGVQLISPTKVVVRGRNPFPWPVELRWRGIMIRRETSRTEIMFIDGSRAVVEGETPRVVEQLA